MTERTDDQIIEDMAKAMVRSHDEGPDEMVGSGFGAEPEPAWHSFRIEARRQFFAHKAMIGSQ
jgi:hypothetical protein